MLADIQVKPVRTKGFWSRVVKKKPIEQLAVSPLLMFMLVIAFVAAAFQQVAFAQEQPASEPSTVALLLGDTESLANNDFQQRDGVLFMALHDLALTTLDAELERETCAGECFRVKVADSSILFKVGGTEMLMGDGKKIVIAAPYRAGEIYFIPAEAFFNALGHPTFWDKEKRLLNIKYQKQVSSAQERFADTLKLKTKKRKEIEKTKEQPVAGEEGAAPVGMQYTYENTTKTEAVRVTGDKTQSSAEEKGDYYNQFNIRFVGQLSNGYDFTSEIKTKLATEPNIKHGEIQTLKLGWAKNRVNLDAGYNLNPISNTQFVMNSYPIQGISYDRGTNLFNWSLIAGKTPKSIRQSVYARYVGALKVEKILSKKNETMISLSQVDVRDTGSLRQANICVALGSFYNVCFTNLFADVPRLDNKTTVANFATKIGKAISFQSEIANSSIGIVGFDKHISAPAVMYKADYKGKNSSVKTSYERTGNDFFSETADFTRGKRDVSVLYNLKTGSSTLFGAGVRDKKIKTDTTRIYPLSFSTKPFGNRENFKFTAKRNFEKTTGSRLRILDNREFQISDKIGTSGLTIKHSRQKNKLPGKELAYKNLKSLTIKTPLSDKLGLQLDLKNERWNKDRSSITRQNRIKFDFEPKEWTNLGLEFSTYYNTPASARITTRFTLQKVNIINDSEWKLELQFDNYRDYNVKSLMLSYGFFR